MSKALIIAQSENGARELSVAARSLAQEVVLFVAGVNAFTNVADKVCHVDVPANRIADDAYVSLKNVFDSEAPQYILAEDCLASLSLIGRLAAQTGAAVITGVRSFDGDTTESLYFGGVGVRYAKSLSDVKMYVIAQGAFDASLATGSDLVEEVAFIDPDCAVEKLSSEALPPASVDLGSATIVVGCGRGFASEDQLQLARDLAAKLGGEVGCTRPLAEGADWFPREAYIGVSGQVVAPHAYIAVGVSGQMQHMVGCSGADLVIAINKDKNAPIFSQCDYGFVGDIATALPALTAAL